MALSVKTIVRIYMLFFAFQIAINMFITFIPSVDEQVTQQNQEYLLFLNNQVNGDFDSQNQGISLLDNFRNSIQTENIFNEGVINAFLGVLKVIVDVTLFLAKLALNILFTPGIIIQILTYRFIAGSSYLFSMGLIVNIFFYMTMFYIIFKRRISSN